MRFQSYFNTAIKIIQLYDGAVPLHHYLKQYFALHKKHGSKDRKYITHLCYNFYRLGKSFTDKSTEEKLKIAIFLCNDNAAEWSFLYDDEWVNNWHILLGERLAFIKTRYDFFSLKDVFPFINEVSETLNINSFTGSFLIQPDVFIRIRPGYNEQIISKLQQQNIPFNIVEENCISFSPSTNIDSIIHIDEEAVIQDYSSQRIKEFLEIIKSAIRNPQSEISNPQSEISNPKSEIVNLKPVWDCCAGSGGKSMLAYDILGKINLTVSDVRTSIIQNLKQRFAKAGIRKYKSLVLDVISAAPKALPLGSGEGFDLIICDAPCTGSGTWSRTPEQLHFFQPGKISDYASLQKKIVSHAILSLKNYGFFLYITCSVFSKENEAIVDFIKEQFRLKLIKMDLLQGYDKKADTMFAALFRKTS